jgi:hypothetical protein
MHSVTSSVQKDLLTEQLSLGASQDLLLSKQDLSFTLRKETLENSKAHLMMEGRNRSL